MQEIRSVGFVCVMVGAALTSCSESSIIGEDFVGEESFSLLYIDTVTVPISTTKFDSLITSQSGNLLIGNNSNANLGTILADAFFLLDKTEGVISIGDGLKYDSITLNLPMDGYTNYLGESGVYRTILVEQLTEELTRLDDFALYNNSVVEGVDDDLELLGEKEFLFTEDRIRNLEISLDYQWGLKLFDALRNNIELLTADHEFKEHLKGFRISFAEEDTPFIGLRADSVSLTIHTSDNFTTPPESISYEFDVGFSPYFTRIDQKNVPEAFSGVMGLEDEISSDQTGNLSLIASGLGYAVKLDLDPIRNSFLLIEDALMVSTILEMQWLEAGENQHLPDTLQANLVDESFIDIAGETLYMHLTKEDDFERNRFYSMDMTSIVDLLLSLPQEEKYFLLLTLKDFNTTITTVLLADQSFDSHLKIYTVSNN